jgi:hypothetical protein
MVRSHNQNKLIYQLAIKNGEVISDFASDVGILGQDSAIAYLGGKTLATLPRSLRKPRWIQETVKPSSSSQPYLWRGTSIVGTEDGEVVAFRVWANNLRGPVGGIGGDGKVLYIGTRRGTVYAYTPR